MEKGLNHPRSMAILDELHAKKARSVPDHLIEFAASNQVRAFPERTGNKRFDVLSEQLASGNSVTAKSYRDLTALWDRLFPKLIRQGKPTVVLCTLGTAPSLVDKCDADFVLIDEAPFADELDII